jgi:hypothetical protein
MHLESRQRNAVAIYLRRGAALCVDHKREADSYRAGRMHNGSTHHDQAGTVPRVKIHPTQIILEED